MITTGEMSDLLLIAVFQRKGARARAMRLATRLTGEARAIAHALLGDDVPLSKNSRAIERQLRRSAARSPEMSVSA